MEQTFKEYLNQARSHFTDVVNKYTLPEHLELLTAVDSFLIAYDQVVYKHNFLEFMFDNGYQPNMKEITSDITSKESLQTSCDYKQLACDICGCHPSTIIRTEYGTFCKAHAKYF